MKLAVRQLVDALAHSCYADVLLDHVVVRSQVLITQRPVLSIAVIRGSFEVQITEAIALPAPDVGAASGDS